MTVPLFSCQIMTVPLFSCQIMTVPLFSCHIMTVPFSAVLIRHTHKPVALTVDMT
jgi:hypothetical protein